MLVISIPGDESAGDTGVTLGETWQRAHCPEVSLWRWLSGNWVLVPGPLLGNTAAKNTGSSQRDLWNRRASQPFLGAQAQSWGLCLCCQPAVVPRSVLGISQEALRSFFFLFFFCMMHNKVAFSHFFTLCELAS